MFADDTKIFSLIANTEDREKLQMILTIYVFGLTINASKCKVLHIGNRNPHYKYSMESIDGTVQAEETELNKDLGVYIDPELKVSKHVERQVNKANRILGLIHRSISYEYFNMEVMKKLFTSLVRPHLEFGNVACPLD